MSVVPANVEYRYTGGVGNVDPNLSLGGVVSTAGAAVVDDQVAHDLFDPVSSAQQAAGHVDYRCVAIKNANGVDTLTDARVYTTTQAEIDVGVAVEAVNVNPATIANEQTAPVGVTFTRPGTYAAGLALNGTTGLVAGAFRGLWTRRTIAAAAAPGTRLNEAIVTEGTTL